MRRGHAGAGSGRHHWRRPAVLLALCVVAALLFSSDFIHAGLLRLLAAAEPLMLAHPLPGAMLFVVLSALSAMLAFFSSVLLVPVAVYAWGRPVTMALLWLGWLLGGAVAYGIGRGLGRPLLVTATSTRMLAFYRQRLEGHIGFPLVLLLQLALPSEIPGYLCGLLRVRFRTYLAALALAEIPYAVGSVLLGESVLQRQGGWLVAIGMIGAAMVGIAAWALRRRLGSPH